MTTDLRTIIRKATHELARRRLKLRKIQRPQRVIMYSEVFTLPAHDEKDWFENYVKDCFERGMSSVKIPREAYALLRYKQALSGSSDGSQLGGFMALSGHVLGDKAKRVYKDALSEFDSKEN